MTDNNETRTIRVVSGDTTFYVTLKPQAIGAMGHEIAGAFTASIKLGAGAKGGYDVRQCLAMLAASAKAFAKGTIVQEDLPAPERDDLAQAP